MTPNAWRRHLGEEAWAHILRGAAAPEGCLDADPAAWRAAATLTAAVEAGFFAPLAPPVETRPTKIEWPTGPIPTAEGLIAYYAAKGIAFTLLRLPQLIRAHAGPMLPRLQETLLAYEEQCGADQVTPLPAWAAHLPLLSGRGRSPSDWAPDTARLGDAIWRETPVATETRR